MADREVLLSALKALPDDVKARLSKGTADQKKIFIDGLSSKLSLQQPQFKPETAMDRQDIRIAQRQDMLSEGIDEAKRQGVGYMANPMNIGNNIKMAGGLMQRAIASAVNPMIAAQRDPSVLINPMKYGPEVLSGIQGKKLGEVGDLYVGAGVKEPYADALGLGTEIALTAPEAAIAAFKPSTYAKIPQVFKAIASKSPTALKDLFSRTSRTEMLNQFREGAYGAKEAAVKNFGAELAEHESKALAKDPNFGINATEPFTSIKNEAAIDGNEKIGSFLKSIPEVRPYLEEGVDLTKISLRDLQNIQNKIQGKLPQSVFKNWNHPLAPIRDFLNDIKAAKVEAFPDMAKTNEAYAKTAEAFKLLKGKISKNGLEDFIKSGFQNTEVKNAVIELMGKGSRSVKRASNFRTATQLRKASGIGTGILGGGDLAFRAWKKARGI